MNETDYNLLLFIKYAVARKILITLYQISYQKQIFY